MVQPSACLPAWQDNSANVYGIDRYSGAERWAYKCLYSASFMPSNVYTARGRVFVGCSDGNVHAINGTSGERLWVHRLFPTIEDLATETSIGGFQGSLDYDHERGIVYIGTLLNYTVALDASNGDVIWRFTVRV